ncbi:DUF938 domain-containing protein [Litoribacillus peritrichatus]|uniref:Class I SAM-dependent methyltransferase n=1 Tax=Litoribacillus peritrichatus TaxID=718191 RepID=A0ABP7MC02_9GAMM
MDDLTTYLNYAPAADRNKEPIWKELCQILEPDYKVLEVGAGSGQHALFFKSSMPELHWQCADQDEYLVPLKLNLNTLAPGQFPEPLVLDVESSSQKAEAAGKGPYDAVYSANTFHIMSWAACEQFFQFVAQVVNKGGYFCLYGPFLYEDRQTVASNLQFDVWLKNRDPLSGVRRFNSVAAQLAEYGFKLIKDVDMPANNQFLVFRKEP